MQNFQGIFETQKRSFVSTFSISMTVPLRKMQTLRVNNSSILGTKNVKFSGYYFCLNINIWGSFRICISVPLSHLPERKFKYNFQDILNPIYNCGQDIESSCHYLLHCSLYTNERLAHLNDIQSIDNSILEFSDSHIFEVLLHRRKSLDSSNKFQVSSNINILDATKDFLLKTKRFDEKLF